MQIRRTLRKIGGRLRPRHPRPAILMYHRVAAVIHDPWGLAVTPQCFEEQIAFLKRHRIVLPMNEFVQRIRGKTLPSNAVAITFDDGYADNLIHAKPVLTRYGVAATVFVATGYVGSSNPFWWDELASMILTSTRPTHLEQSCAGESVALVWQQAERFDLEGTWQASEPPRTARQSSFLAIWQRLKRAQPCERGRVMEALRLHFETPPDPLALPMDANQIRALVSGDLLTVGAHSVTHAALTCLTTAECRREIHESGQRCQALAGESIDGFAYPYGDTNLDVCADVAAARYQWACSTRHAFVDVDEPDFYALPRLAVPNAPMRTFARLITA